LTFDLSPFTFDLSPLTFNNDNKESLTPETQNRVIREIRAKKITIRKA
jgi:hypothetical protein